MSEQRYYMVCLNLQQQPCLVVGGGAVATEKVVGLLDAGAQVLVVAPDISTELARLPVTLQRRLFEPSDLDEMWLVIAATDDRELNRAVSEAAVARSIFCNVADDPELCSFILPAIHRRDPILIGVSTGGASPALAQRLRREIAALVTPKHVAAARKLATLRPWAKAELPTYEARRDFFQRLLQQELG
jgi:precorrin-2 dehydrogenase / sirohydrochlorin ferrochelatase